MLMILSYELINNFIKLEYTFKFQNNIVYTLQYTNTIENIFLDNTLLIIHIFNIVVLF